MSDRRSRPEWGIQYYGNAVAIASYDSHDAALRALNHHRQILRGMGIPEEYWPILLSRIIETTTGSWEHQDV